MHGVPSTWGNREVVHALETLHCGGSDRRCNGVTRDGGERFEVEIVCVGERVRVEFQQRVQLIEFVELVDVDFNVHFDIDIDVNFDVELEQL